MRNLALVWVLAGVAVAFLAAGDGKPPVSTFTDKRDGKVYRIVKIGGQVWFAENLNYAADGSKCYGEGGDVVVGIDEDGDAIKTTLSNAEVQTNCTKYGRLYNWETAMGGASSSNKVPSGVQGVCPAGWYIPSNYEWDILEGYVGGFSKEAGTKLKSKSGWSRNGGGTNEYGFSGLPGGNGNSDGDFYYAGSRGFWWSSTENAEPDTGNAWYRGMDYGIEKGCYGNDKSNLFSVRCIQDKQKERRK
jgi:uncharacterized protein (TIGR02145 family)